MPEKDSTTFLQEVLQTVHAIGEEKTIRYLKHARSKEQINETGDPSVSFVMELIYTHFKVTLADINRKPQQRTDLIKFGFAFAIYGLKELHFTSAQLENLFKRKRSTLFEKEQNVLQLNPKSKVDKNYLHIKELIDQEIKAFKKKNFIR